MAELTKQQTNRLDKLVDASFNRHCAGRQYNMLDLPRMARLGKAAGYLQLDTQSANNVKPSKFNWVAVQLDVDDAMKKACEDFQLKAC